MNRVSRAAESGSVKSSGEAEPDTCPMCDGWGYLEGCETDSVGDYHRPECPMCNTARSQPRSAPESAAREAEEPGAANAPKPVKPLGRKAYGSIPHLPGSRLGPGDWSITEGQRIICMDRARDRRDRIIVTEKLDGSNVAVARIGEQIVALTRAGYAAADSPYLQHHVFGEWIARQAPRFLAMLNDGERLNGEWLALAHGTIYELPHEPFVAFDMMVGPKRLPWDEITARCARAGVVTAAVLHDGPPIHIDAVLPILSHSRHGAVDPVEGAVWRVERDGQFDFNAKWVRPDKIDGKYLNDITGHPEVWHWGAPLSAQPPTSTLDLAARPNDGATAEPSPQSEGTTR